MSEFPYVDITYPGLSEWKRIRIDEIQEHFQKCNGYNFCVSTQRYKSPVREENELHVSDFVLDIDTKNNLQRAQKTTIAVVEYFKNKLHVPNPYPRIWFSGQKGFHVLVPKDMMQISPHSQLHKMFEIAASQLETTLNVSDIDKKIYSKRRVLRFPNAIHPETKLHKIEITYDELKTLSVDEIRKLAKHPRMSLPGNPRFFPVDPVPDMVAWWNAITKHWNNQVQYSELRPKKSILVIQNELPLCIRTLLELKPPEGMRNRTTLVLASFFYNQKYPIEKTQEVLLEWVEKHYGDEANRIRERIANTLSVIKSTYENGYFFSCSICKSINPDQNYCVGVERCPFIDTPDDQEPDSIPLVELDQASNVIYATKVIRTPVHISAVAERPYITPKKIHIFCENPPKELDGNCLICPLAQKPIDYVFTMKSAKILKLIDVTDSRKFENIRAMFDLPKCKNVNIQITELGNLQLVIMNPMINQFNDVKNLYQGEEAKQSTFVTRVGYYFGHDVTANKSYYAVNVVHPDPNSSKAVHLIDELIPATSTLESFHPSDKMLEQLTIFQQGDQQTVIDKLNEIHDDFEDNIHKIVKRRIWAFAVDLTYHSPLSFYFFDDFIVKGWMETVCVGDSAQGKTELAKRLQKHFQLGAWTSAEGEGRVGLAFSKQQISVGKGASQWFVGWGILPQNDRGLVIIDEFAGIKFDDFAELTAARDSGVIESTGVVKQATYMRTRAIYMSNARGKGKGTSDGGSLGQYTYGIEAIAGLYRDHQDLRRVDFGVVVKKGDVSITELNTARKSRTTHKYTSELCKNLILWAWTRTPKQIIWEPGAEQEVLNAAIRISQKYATPKMYLVDPSTQKFKVARLAIATAMRLFSTENYQDVIVRIEHVQFAEQLFYLSYDSPGMQYDVYAMHNRDVPNIPEHEKLFLLDTLRDAVQGKRNIKSILKTLVQADKVNESTLRSCGMSLTRATEVMLMFREKDLVDANDVKTPTGVDLFKTLYHRV